jgi:hypothetical protein
MKRDPMLCPIIVSCIAHDYIYNKWGYHEEIFRAALYKSNIHEDPDIANYM